VREPVKYELNKAKINDYRMDVNMKANETKVEDFLSSPCVRIVVASLPNFCVNLGA
jgi:hypothetical protein